MLNLKRLDVEMKPVNFNDYKRRHAVEADCDNMITDPVAVYINNELRIVYAPLPDDPLVPELVKALSRIKYNSGSRRTNGLTSPARTFGYLPRRTLRADFCHVSKWAVEDPAGHALLCSYAAKLSRFYEETNPDLYFEHHSLTQKVLPDYQIPDAVFTSGIVNKDNWIPYHHDAGNFKQVWSSMLVFKKDIQGGHLICPELNMKFFLPDNSLFMFDGQGILHGVTPIIKTSRKAYRYSIVYYSMKDLWQCKTPGEELDRIQKVKTERERKRAEVARERLNNAQ